MIAELVTDARFPLIKSLWGHKLQLPVQVCEIDTALTCIQAMSSQGFNKPPYLYSSFTFSLCCVKVMSNRIGKPEYAVWGVITNRTAQPVSPIEFVSLPQHKGKLENYIYKLGIAFRITSILLCNQYCVCLILLWYIAQATELTVRKCGSSQRKGG